MSEQDPHLEVPGPPRGDRCGRPRGSSTLTVVFRTLEAEGVGGFEAAWTELLGTVLGQLHAVGRG